jgi:NADP-dependent 3-hydroxy acid dehydrogenase YdfG
MTQGASKGRLGVVTGAGSGIGQAIALELAALGVDLWLLGRRAETLEATAALVRARGAQAWTSAIDLRSDVDLRRFRDQIRKAGDGLDILVHSAGAHFLGSVADAPVAELDEQYQVNLRAPYVLTQLLLPMLLGRQGQIVFVNSSSGLESRARVGAYAATKHALKALADALRQEVNGDGIRVISVYPGRTATPLQEAVHAQEGSPYDPERLLQPGDVAAAVVHAIEMERTAEVTDIRVRPMQPPGAR